MDHLQPIYTEPAQCQDCYKCLRQCTAKAIKVRQGHAMVIPELCVLCGHCVKVCPVGAKRIRNDIERTRLLLRRAPKVVASVAPSYLSQFPDISEQQFILALKKLGFAHVSQTAIGAQEVSAHTAAIIAQKGPDRYISSACPTVVELIKKYHHQYAHNVMNLLSPVLAHCKLIKKQLGENTAVVFIGPCISKKIEADKNPELLEIALTFTELQSFFEQQNIDPAQLPTEPDQDWMMGKADLGAIYPVDGGMIAGVKANCTVADADFMAFSGIQAVRDVLSDLHHIGNKSAVFLELLACKGGCVNGPCMKTQKATAVKRHQILTNRNSGRQSTHGQIDITHSYDIAPVVPTNYNPDQIKNSLAKVGKFRPEDELNCSGCGYDSCSQFAQAMLDDRAEPTMCLSYMRQLAHKKANALIRTIPCGVVIVDENLRLVQCNERFAQMCGPEAVQTFQAKPGLENADLKKLMPLANIFTQVLRQNAETVEKDLKLGTQFLHITAFNIEPNRFAGAIIQDITEPAVQKERIITKSREVMRKNVETVQKIAYLLGENAADAEIILNSIVESFSAETVDDDNPDNN